MSIGTIAKMAAAAVASALATGTVSHFWNKKENKAAEARGEKNGAAREKAKYDETLKQNDAHYESLAARFAETNDMFKLAVALATVGYSCAASTGRVGDRERDLVDEYVAGMMSVKLPSHIRLKLRDVLENPPAVRTAHAFAKEVADRDTWHLFDEIITEIVEIDSTISPDKHNFRRRWNLLRAAA